MSIKRIPLDWEPFPYDFNVLENELSQGTVHALLNELDFLLLERVAGNDGWRLVVSAMRH